MKAKILECAKVAFGVALSIGVGYLMLHYAENPEPAAPYRQQDAIHGTQEDLPATCTIGQVFIAQDTNKAYACATMWTEIPITVIEEDKR